MGKPVRILLVLLYALLLNSAHGISQEVKVWTGKNLTEIVYRDGEWNYREGYLNYLITELDGRYVGPVTPIGKRDTYDFDLLDPERDTIELTSGLLIKRFVRSDLVEFGELYFKAFTYSVIAPDCRDSVSYSLNQHGFYRKANEHNETVVEKYISEELLDQFLNLLVRIDLRNRGRSGLQRIPCWKSVTHKFERYTIYGDTYTTAEPFLREQFVPLTEFLEHLSQ